MIHKTEHDEGGGMGDGGFREEPSSEEQHRAEMKIERYQNDR